MANIEKTAIFGIAVRYLRLAQLANRELFFAYGLLLFVAVTSAIAEWSLVLPKVFVIMVLCNIWIYIRSVRRVQNYVYTPEDQESVEA